MMNRNLLHTKTYTLATEIALYITKHVDANQGFGERSFYGESFTLLLLKTLKMEAPSCCSSLKQEIFDKDCHSETFHWEFNRYALFLYRALSDDRSFDPLIFSGKFNGTPCTNWTLLRNNTRLLLGESADSIVLECRDLLSVRQKQNGLICDEKGVNSFQYHCFSLAMLAEIHSKTASIFIRNRLEQGLKFIRRFILEDGDTLYIGRGQQQSFGYAALIYTYSYAIRHAIVNANEKKTIHQLLAYLTQFQKEDGSFPLVMNHHEPSSRSSHHPLPAGWYAYNNYFDYLPFLGFYLAKSAELLKAPLTHSNHKNVEEKKSSYWDGDFGVERRPSYEAVVSKPGGYLTNDQTIPYIKSHGNHILPCYGGEQFGDRRYSAWNLPNIRFPQWQKTIRSRSISKLWRNHLLMLSPLGFMFRKFHFDERRVTIYTKAITLFDVEIPFAFYESTKQLSPTLFQDTHHEIRSSSPLVFEGQSLCAQGVLNLFICQKKSTTLWIDLKNEN